MASNENAKYKSKYMGRWKVTHSGNQYVFDDRFLITQQTFCKCTIVDLFHPKQKFFRFDFSSCEIEGSPSTTNEYLVRSVFAMNLGTALVLFQLSDSSSLYVGIGNIDLERSLVVVNQSTFVSTFDDTFSHAWLPLSNPPTVCKGVVLGITTYFPLRFGYFLVKMENQLTVSEVLLPLNTGFVAGFDGHLYALAYDEASNNNNANRPIDLIEIDLLKGKQNRKRTINLNVAEDVDLTSIRNLSYYACCIGRTIFVKRSRGMGYEIVSLDLDTLQWRRTDIVLKDVWTIGSDGTKALIVQTSSNASGLHETYRFGFNQPDKLSDLVWLQLKRIFDDRPSAYYFILSQLPANFKQKCPLNFN